ncbi:MAG: diaminopimelate epimerase [Clostridiales bacterium]|nr:diaminopimelate epimerase [Clostridiales bacterium]
MNFIKMHGCGNDYIYFDCMAGEAIDPHKLDLFRLCDRHKGIGGDGIVLILPSMRAHGRMKMFNADGSEGMMCGNAIRCVAKFLHMEGYAPSKMRIETASGIKHVELLDGGFAARVDMGRAEISPEITLNGYSARPVDMGNPHIVIFLDEIENLDLEEIGPTFERHELFPGGVNTEFVQVLNRNHLKMRVWERGSGETLACGTGACAAAAAAVLKGYCDPEADITVDLRGGSLIINYSENTVFMTGEAVKVYEGVIS